MVSPGFKVCAFACNPKPKKIAKTSRILMFPSLAIHSKAEGMLINAPNGAFGLQDFTR